MEEDSEEMAEEVDESDSEEVVKSDDETELVKDAVLDLDGELARIRKERDALNAQIKKIDYIIKNAEEVGKKVERLRYQRRIAKLDSQEAELLQRKKKLQQKSESLGKRMSKVKKAKESLSEV